jgi:hypothetical protein
MEPFKMLLDKLDAALREYNPIAYENLRPPFPDAVIDKNLGELGISDENVKALFQWKGGMKYENGCRMMLFGGLLTFDSIKESIEFNEYYDPLLIPLISDNGEEMLLFNSKPGSHYGKLYFYSVPELYIEHPVSYYDSLNTMVQTTIKAYSKKAYEYNTDRNRLDIEGHKFDEIAKNYNKNCVYWTTYNPLKWEEWYEI